VYVTALDGDSPIVRARRMLVTVVGPARNTGMEYETTAEMAARHKVPFWRIKAVGTSPVLMDAVEGSLRIRHSNAGSLAAWALDVNGKRTGEAKLERTSEEVTLPLSASAAAVYYEIGSR
jgi:hypothetical protein